MTRVKSDKPTNKL